MEVLVGIMYN